MTAYVRAISDVRGGWYLWADTPEEAMTAAAWTGANVLTQHKPDRAEGHYDLTLDQWVQAVGQGAQIRPLADAWANAQTRNGRTDLLARSHLDALAGIA